MVTLKVSTAKIILDGKFIVMDLQKYPVVLGIQFCREHNIQFDWKSRKVKISNHVQFSKNHTTYITEVDYRHMKKLLDKEELNFIGLIQSNNIETNIKSGKTNNDFKNIITKNKKVFVTDFTLLNIVVYWMNVK